jgi:predicted metal-binding membrane protein
VRRSWHKTMELQQGLGEREALAGRSSVHSAAVTSERTTAATAAVLVTLGLAAVSWGVTIDRMDGMDMGVDTELGSFGFFIATWIPMMAAMMLSGAAPAVARRARIDGAALAVPLFLCSYLAVWTLVGIGVYAVYEPHGTAVAGGLTIAASVYELTPLKRSWRRRCGEEGLSGLRFGVFCVGSSIGLMVMFVALGVMSITWMAVVAAVIVAQKVLPAKAAVDVPVALAIVGLGVLIVLAPSSAPGLTSM